MGKKEKKSACAPLQSSQNPRRVGSRRREKGRGGGKKPQNNSMTEKFHSMLEKTMKKGRKGGKKKGGRF